LAEFIPELESIQKTSITRPEVEIYIGTAGLKTIYDGMLAEGKDIYHIMNYDEYSKLFQLFFIKNFIKKRVDKGIWFRAIVNHIKDVDIEKSDPTTLREIRNLQELENSKATIFFYGDKCGFFTFEETPMGVIIKNKMLAQSFKVVFEMMWKNGKKT